VWAVLMRRFVSERSQPMTLRVLTFVAGWLKATLPLHDGPDSHVVIAATVKVPASPRRLDEPPNFHHGGVER